MDIISSQFLILVPVVLGVVQAIKIAFKVDSKWAPLISVISGVVGAYSLFPVASVGVSILQGLVVGLTACGLWSGTKTTVGN